jgi:hypothetical protein
MAEKDRGEEMTEQALETGRFGAPSAIENDAFTLQGQGPETAQREREVREQLRSEQRAASMDTSESSGSSSSSSRRSRRSKSSEDASSSS